MDLEVTSLLPWLQARSGFLFRSSLVVAVGTITRLWCGSRGVSSTAKTILGSSSSDSAACSGGAGAAANSMLSAGGSGCSSCSDGGGNGSATFSLASLADLLFLPSLALVSIAMLWWDDNRSRRQLEAETKEKLSAHLRIAEFAQQGLLADEEAKYAPIPKASCLSWSEEDSLARSEACKKFEALKRKTQCLFAQKAFVWGNDWVEEPAIAGCSQDPHFQLLSNVARTIPRFYRFCLEVKAGAALDAFVFEARGSELCSDIDRFATTVRLVLSGLSRGDPAGVDCMQKTNIAKASWYFQFARESFFVTSFAPCYSETHPRYQFGLHPESCFILFQPEMAFLRHDLPPDRPKSDTNWQEPSDIRDRIRVNFRKHGREYKIPETISYPPAEFIVPPLDVNDTPIAFWKSSLPPPTSSSSSTSAPSRSFAPACPGALAAAVTKEELGTA